MAIHWKTRLNKKVIDKTILNFSVSETRNSSLVPDLASHFNGLSTITVDYTESKYYDNGLLSFYLWTTIMSISGSAICIVLNSFLIICILTTDDFQNWIFFPVCVQAAIDIAGPGFANIAYSVISFGNLRDGINNVEYFRSDDFEVLTFVDGNLGCFLTFFRSILNEYTTGVCVLTSAFFRYCLICHPTARIAAAENLRKVSMALFTAIAIIMTLSVWDLAVNGRQIDSLFNTNVFKKGNRFIWNCQYFIFRNNVHRPILTRDIVLFFCVPASVSAFFNLRTFRVLHRRERNQHRNRNLILAFVMNWILWVISWTIYYTTMAVKLGYESTRKSISERTYLDVVEERLTSSKELFCLLYSQLNPVFFLVILKPFQKKFLCVLKNAICSNKNGANETQRNHLSNAKLKPDFSQSKKVFVQKKFWTFCVIIFLLAASSIVFITKICVDVSTSSSQLKDDCFASRIQTRYVHEKQVLKFMFFKEAFPTEFRDPRLKCGTLRGSFGMNNERCYFSLKHSAEKELNLTEQAEVCRSHNATLAYPTNFDEAGFLFRFYLFDCGSDCRKNVSFGMNRWFIRLGFKKVPNKDGIVFTTFDGNLVVESDLVSGNSNSVDGNSSTINGSVTDYNYEYDYYDYEGDYDYVWYRYDYSYIGGLLNGETFSSSAVCLTYRYKVFPCLARLKLPVTVCFFDFSTKYHLPPLKIFLSDL